MDNLYLANKLEALFPIDDLDIRIALVSVMKSVLNAGTNGPRQRFVFSDDEGEYLPFFIKELLAQPLLMNALFPGKSPSEVRKEFSGLAVDGHPLIRDIYSMLTKNMLLDDALILSNADLAYQADMIATPDKRQFIWQLLSQYDANYVIQYFEDTIESRMSLSPVSVLTEEYSYEPRANVESIKGLYDLKASVVSPVLHSTYIKFPALRECINQDGRIPVEALSLLIYAGVNQRVTREQEKNSIDTLRFIYNELQKAPHERIPEFQHITESSTGAVISKKIEERICKEVVNKLQRYFGVGVEDKVAVESMPSVLYSQRYKKVVASRQDELDHSDDITQELSYKSKKY